MTECHLQFTSYSSLPLLPKASLLSFIFKKNNCYSNIYSFVQFYKAHLKQSVFPLDQKEITKEIDKLNARNRDGKM